MREKHIVPDLNERLGRLLTSCFGLMQQLLKPLSRGFYDRQRVAHGGLTQPVRSGHGHGRAGQAEEVVHASHDEAIRIKVNEPLVLSELKEAQFGHRLCPCNVS